MHAPLHGGLVRTDRPLASVMRRLWKESRRGSPMGPLLADDVAAFAAARMARLAMRASGIAGRPAPEAPLDRRRAAKVELIADRLGEAERLRLTDLAAAAGLSAHHFSRAFRATFGVAPHRYILLRRIAEAQIRLCVSGDSVTKIAAECGFADHSHLANAMRRETGRSPSDWRGGSIARLSKL